MENIFIIDPLSFAQNKRIRHGKIAGDKLDRLRELIDSDEGFAYVIEGRVSPTHAEHVEEDLGQRVAMILDGGATAHGLESTIVDGRGDAAILLRSGAVAREAIEAVVGAPLARCPESDDVHPTAPGQLTSHYAPNALMRLNARDVRPGEALLAFGSDVPDTANPVLNLSVSGDLVEAAAALFAALRALDRMGTGAIAVMPIPERGLGEAINDRLRRAAAPRPA